VHGWLTGATLRPRSRLEIRVRRRKTLAVIALDAIESSPVASCPSARNYLDPANPSNPSGPEQGVRITEAAAAGDPADTRKPQTPAAAARPCD